MQNVYKLTEEQKDLLLGQTWDGYNSSTQLWMQMGIGLYQMRK